MKSKKIVATSLPELMNVGKAVMRDLTLLKITSIKQLAHANVDDLYKKLERLTGHHQDPCVWDVFAAIIHEAKTGEKIPWWHVTPMRKKKQLAAPLCEHAKKQSKR